PVFETLRGSDAEQPLKRRGQWSRSGPVRSSWGFAQELGSSRAVKCTDLIPHAASAALGSATARESAVQQLRSQWHLQVCTAQVARATASFFWLPSRLAAVANSELSVGRIQALAPLALRNSRCSLVREPGCLVTRQTTTRLRRRMRLRRTGFCGVRQ